MVRSRNGQGSAVRGKATAARLVDRSGDGGGQLCKRGPNMKLRLASLVAAVLGCVMAIVSSAVVSADAPDPHQPDLARNYCPGGQWNAFYTQVCDGQKYPDGSYWHQWVRDPSEGGRILVTTGPQWHHDCVGDSGNNVLPAPPPPGGCAGAIPRA